MDSATIRQKFLDFFEEKGHTVVPSSSLVTDDPSVLFTTAGMQQFKPYYLGKPSPYGQNVVSVQKCVRTSDIDEVGDESHLTFFEMLGNFSFGGYWKEEAIEYAHEFITKEMGLKIDYVTVFEGEEGVPEDTESEKIWKSIDSNIVIKKFGRKDNFWGPTGEEGPCGPTTEIYVNGLEIWNIVFNEFYQNKDRTLKPLEMKGIDTGMGLERLAMVVQKVPTVFDTDLFVPIVGIAKSRVVADHIRTSVFMVSDGVTPSNTERGYVLRRLIRRACMQIKSVTDVIDVVRSIYGLSDEKITRVITEEAEKFSETLAQGLKEYEKGRDPFVLVTSFGLPFDEVKKLAEQKGIQLDKKDFDKKFKKHQELSRAGSEQKFKGGLAGHSEIEVRYHTATHLLHQALRDVLGKEVEQKGSNITPERLRFDFAFPRKMTDEEKEKVEEIVNSKIAEAIPVENVVMNKEEAIKSGALHFFDQKYPDQVSVYKIGDYSKEFCGGPHVKNISELGVFKITKEEAISTGVRRIKATLQ
ncbi:MAG: alanine--tRNA ligase [Patescibacteria group bacterium]